MKYEQYYKIVLEELEGSIMSLEARQMYAKRIATRLVKEHETI
jgi:hypothetical protein